MQGGGRMTANEKRQAVCDLYTTILGRNKYSQPKRDYCFKKYKDGYYYSDCSSSVSYCYKNAGYSFGILNTVGMYQSKKMTDVPVVIKNGIIQNPEVLRIGDMLLFAGGDSGRSYAGYVGHVEMVYEIKGDTYKICGHGSGNPSVKTMNTYCRSRYNSKSKTKLGHKGLIRVRRFIQDDEFSGDTTTPSTNNPSPAPVAPAAQKVTITGGRVNIRYGPDSGEYKIKKTVSKGDVFTGVDTTGWKCIDYKGVARWIYAQYVSSAGTCTGKSVNIRKGPSTDYASIGIANKGDMLDVLNCKGWNPITFDGQVYWVTGIYSKVK